MRKRYELQKMEGLALSPNSMIHCLSELGQIHDLYEFVSRSFKQRWQYLLHNSVVNIK